MRDDGPSPGRTSSRSAASGPAGSGEVPWFATAVELDRSVRHALRPVPEDEIEELDEDFSEWDVTSSTERAESQDGAGEPMVAQDPARQLMERSARPPDLRVAIDGFTRRIRAVGPRGPGAATTPGAPEAATCVAVAVGHAMRAERHALGETQAVYARRTARDQALISRIERGVRELTVADVVQVATETGRAIRIEIRPLGDHAVSSTETLSQQPFGQAGMLRIAVGRARERNRGESSVGYRLPYTIS